MAFSKSPLNIERADRGCNTAVQKNSHSCIFPLDGVFIGNYIWLVRSIRRTEMTALGWVREKAAQYAQEIMEVTPEEGAATDCAPGRYLITRFKFEGRVPPRMIYQLREQLADLVQTETEQEMLRLNGEYRGDFGKCIYYRTTYEFLG